MRIQDILSDFMDLLSAPKTMQEPTVIAIEPEEKPGQLSPLTHAGDDINRWRQIVDLADTEESPFNNSPNEKYADVDAVTIHAGGGVNGPKHPADIKGNSISIYPNFLAKGE